MAKFFGPIGYAKTSETAPGVWSEGVTEVKYSGDIIRNSRHYQTGESLSDDINLNNKISIVADTFAFDNLHNMRYIKWMGVAWKITNIDYERPRLILSIGGVYNGNTTPTPDPT